MKLTHNRPPIHLFAALGVSLLLTACGGGGSNPDPSGSSYTVTTSAGAGGSFDRASEAVDSGNSTSFTVTADTGYGIDSVSGCDGSLSGNTYTTGAIKADCSITASFVPQFSVSVSAGANGAITPTSALVNQGSSTSFTITPDSGYGIASASGCDGSLSGNTYTTGAITADCSVSASFAINQYQVLTSVAYNSGGGFDLPGALVNHGSTASFTLTADTGYSLGSASGCGGSLSGNTYTTGPVTSGCTVMAFFNINEYSVTASAGANGSIAPASVTVNHGSNTSFIVTPDANYHIDSVSGCGGSLSGNTYTTAPITAACSVSASFAIDQHTVTTSAGSGGSFNAASAVVDHGSSTSFTVTPDANYHIDSVSGCGGSLSGDTYTTGAITVACSVSASFAIDHYTVSASAGANGSIAPTSATVNHGSSTSFTVTPDANYHIDSVSGCGGSLSGNTYTTGVITAACSVSASFAIDQYTVSASAGANGNIAPASATVDHGSSTSFTVTPDANYHIDSVSGCGGSLSGNTYTTAAITAACSVSASFAIDQHTVTTSAGSGGSFNAASAAVDHGSSTSFTLIPDSGFRIVSASGCGGSLSGSTYTTDSITADCTVSASFTDAPASAPSPTLGFGIKQLQFTWPSVAYTHHYRILANPDGASGFSVVTGAESITTLGHNVDVPVHQLDWVSAEYLVEACNADNSICLSSTNQTLTAADAIAATGYFKASNTGSSDYFGLAVSLSADGNTLAVGATQEDVSASNAGAVYVFVRGESWSQQAFLKASNAGGGDNFGKSLFLSADGNTLAVGTTEEDSITTGINGDETDNSAGRAGAVYVFSRSGSTWSQQAYVKASNTEANDYFGASVSLSSDGNTLAVGAYGEGSAATGINGDQTDNSADFAGAVYVYSRSGATWSQQAYVKASNSDASDYFGWAVSLSGDGNTLAVGAYQEDSAASGINGDQTDNTIAAAGAVYVFSRSGTTWSQQTYVKASNTGGDYFGKSVSLSSDGATLAVGADYEGSAATGVNGDQSSNSAFASGAVYVFSHNGTSWSQQAYVKASNTTGGEQFGEFVSLSADGSTLAVATKYEGSSATGINGDQTDNTANFAGAVYVFSYDGASWAQQAYVKALNTEAGDYFGSGISVSGDGTTLAVGAYQEDSAATGINGDQTSNSVSNSGAVYLY